MNREERNKLNNKGKEWREILALAIILITLKLIYSWITK
jgi:hypothetical protein